MRKSPYKLCILTRTYRVYVTCAGRSIRIVYSHTYVLCILTEAAAEIIAKAKAERANREMEEAEARAKADADLKEKAVKRRNTREEKVNVEAETVDWERSCEENKNKENCLLKRNWATRDFLDYGQSMTAVCC